MTPTTTSPERKHFLPWRPAIEVCFSLDPRWRTRIDGRWWSANWWFNGRCFMRIRLICIGCCQRCWSLHISHGSRALFLWFCCPFVFCREGDSDPACSAKRPGWFDMSHRKSVSSIGRSGQVQKKEKTGHLCTVRWRFWWSRWRLRWFDLATGRVETQSTVSNRKKKVKTRWGSNGTVPNRLVNTRF